MKTPKTKTPLPPPPSSSVSVSRTPTGQNPGPNHDRASPLMRVEGLCKTFQHGDVVVHANREVCLDIHAGRIQALLGENGAGKSTLVKMLYGALRPDSGSMFWKGEPLFHLKPSKARALGIGQIFQHFTTFDALTVLENIALGIPGARVNEKLKHQIERIGESYGLSIRPDAVVETLSVGEKQRLEILRTLLQDPKLLIMDEPTSVLTAQEARQLFETLRKLRDEGRAILYISHKLDEIKALCESAVIMRLGRVVDTCLPSEVSVQAMAAKMMGSQSVVQLKKRSRPAAAVAAASEPEPLFEVRDLSARKLDVPITGISFTLRAGEIFGIAGIAGNGQTELMSLLIGETRPDSGHLLLQGVEVTHALPRQRRQQGMAFIPEERRTHAASADLPLTDNFALACLDDSRYFTSRGWCRGQAVRDAAGAVLTRHKVVAGGVASLAGTLSGGNLQKFIVGRELAQDPRVFVIAQPTWGVDVGSAQSIRANLLAQAASGAALLVLSQDLDELFKLSDHIAVLNRGHLLPAHPAKTRTPEDIGQDMSRTAFEGLPDV